MQPKCICCFNYVALIFIFYNEYYKNKILLSFLLYAENYLYMQVACLLSFCSRGKPVFAVTALALQSSFKKSTEVVPADGSRDHKGQTFFMT